MTPIEKEFADYVLSQGGFVAGKSKTNCLFNDCLAAKVIPRTATRLLLEFLAQSDDLTATDALDENLHSFEIEKGVCYWTSINPTSAVEE